MKCNIVWKQEYENMDWSLGMSLFSGTAIQPEISEKPNWNQKIKSEARAQQAEEWHWAEEAMVPLLPRWKHILEF